MFLCVVDVVWRGMDKKCARGVFFESRGSRSYQDKEGTHEGSGLLFSAPRMWSLLFSRRARDDQTLRRDVLLLPMPYQWDGV